ncbi:MAG TPA: nucleotidyltransferase domain-containing protein [Alphaproteobacteria bacterium]|jgi:hypothetical protein|nr:nucleotidyltransferase domain-containing protein [Alphaproteobacteria bacterium]
MIFTPLMKDDTKGYIQKKLWEISSENNVRILLAIESGSRAWGFPSKDSDYDVRFLYARNKDTYLSIKNYRDLIEIPIIHNKMLGVPLDLNGWDIRKALQLAIKSNPILLEWLTSPIRYIYDQEASDNLLAFTKETVNLRVLHYHYDRLARNAWEKIQQDTEQVKFKLYCYALRPVLALHWISKYKQPPPMHMEALCPGILTDQVLHDEIANLIKKKFIANEADMISRSTLLDAYIADILQNKAERPSDITEDTKFIQKADKVFQHIIRLV